VRRYVDFVRLELDRRQVLVALAACGAAAACRPPASTVPVRPQLPTTVPPSTTTTTPSALPPGLALARRFSFGPTPDLVASAAAGVEAFFDAQVDPRRVELAATTALVESIDAQWSDAPQARADDPAATMELRRAAATAAAMRSVALSAWSNLQLRQVAADFFADHLHVSISEQPTVFFVPSYDAEVIRSGALGRFADLLVASARSSAMLVYLDNVSSRAGRGRVPNENYARELLELHTVGVSGDYDEADVVEVAHVLSGWSLDPTSKAFTFRPTWHDLGPLSAGGDVLGWRPSNGGVRDGESFLQHLARLPATARFVCWKLARRFVADDIRPEDPLVSDLAETYLREDTAIVPVLRAAARRSDHWTPKVRRPLELIAASLRMGGPTPTPEQLTAALPQVRVSLDSMGQIPWQWPAPNGYPDSNGAWSGPGAMIARWNTATAAGGGFGALPTHAGPSPRTLLGHEPGATLAAAVRSAPSATVVRALTFASPEFQVR
jgi:uncharacterized protein (DUF1800 family)